LPANRRGLPVCRYFQEGGNAIDGQDNQLTQTPGIRVRQTAQGRYISI